MEGAQSLVFFVNGWKVVEKRPDPDVMLLSYLRYTLRLTGSKSGCGEGGCGACTVMLSEYDNQAKTIRHYSANACLVPLCYLHGLSVTTVEGIGSIGTRLHPVQERLAQSHGSQCGFCTPGMVMSMYALLRNHPKPTEEQLLYHLDGNLCRCTGYRPILEGFRTFTQGECGLGEACCRNNTITNGEVNGIRSTSGTVSHQYPDYDSTQEPIFPPELKNKWASYHGKSLVFKNDHVTWYRPATLSEVLDLKSAHPEAKIVVGNTEIGIETRFKGQTYPVQIQATHVSELKAVSWSESAVTFGASVTVSVVIDTLRGAIKDMPEEETRIYRGMLDVLQWFGGTQTRNVCSIGGNILTASPLSDLNPLLMAAGTRLQVARKGSSICQVKMDSSFLPSYRKTSLAPEDILVSVTIPKSSRNLFYQGYKQANRKEDDISIVNAGMKVVFEDNSDIVKSLHLAYGGMAPTTVMATSTMQSLTGSPWNEDLVTKATSLLTKELHLEPGSPGGMTEYRQTLAVSLFFKFYMTVQLALDKQKGVTKSNVLTSYRSAVSDIDHPLPTASHIYDDVSPDQRADDTVGRAVVHDSGIQHTTGEAVFVDDITPRTDELFMSLVLSERAHAFLVSVDPTEAMDMPGVVDFITSKDVPGSNDWGLVGSEEKVFATDRVLCKGQTIGAIVAETRDEAKSAAAKVKVTYKDLEPILTIKEAISHKSFYGDPNVLTNGDPEAVLKTCDHVLEGEARTGAQEHFYLENTGSIVIPAKHDGRVEVHTVTQATDLAQRLVGSVLGMSENKVVIRVKRIGGAFGGKQTRNLLTALPAAVAAHKHGRAVRCVLDRDVDMKITGTRNPMWAKYKVGFNNDGKILAFCPEVYVNGGMSQDYSRAVIGKMKLHVDASYNIPNLSFKGYACRTNIPSNTAFRGFGVPQITMVTEQMIQLVADTLDKSPVEIRRINLYQSGDVTHFGQVLSPCNIGRCWEECKMNSSFDRRRREADAFNSENRWKKRGLSMVPVKYGLIFPSTSNFLNQASALVHIYLDGSVLVTHGGVEMGQGINIKMMQIASRVLHIPISLIHTDETSTDKIHNQSPSAGSNTTDLQGMAVKDACQTLYDRLLPYIKTKTNGTWKDWTTSSIVFNITISEQGEKVTRQPNWISVEENKTIILGKYDSGISQNERDVWPSLIRGTQHSQVNAAYSDRVQLMATGFYKRTGLHYSSDSDNNNMYDYFVYGAGCSEVEIDCLTGEHHILRTDMVIDAGRSLNPAVDIGQVEGSFIHGYGLYILEQYKVAPDGTLLSQGPGTYKVPSLGNIPWKLNLHLLKDSDNHKGMYGSKGVGEPPMILSLSVFFAIEDAIKSAREDAGFTDRFQLDCPSTPEVVRLACQDQFTQKFPPAPEGSFKPWTVQLS